MKFVLWLAILGGFWWLWSKRKAADAGTAQRDGRQPESERMVTCAHCGVHLPVSEGIVDQGLTYCCEAHRDQARQKRA